MLSQFKKTETIVEDGGEFYSLSHKTAEEVAAEEVAKAKPRLTLAEQLALNKSKLQQENADDLPFPDETNEEEDREALQEILDKGLNDEDLVEQQLADKHHLLSMEQRVNLEINKSHLTRREFEQQREMLQQQLLEKQRAEKRKATEIVAQVVTTENPFVIEPANDDDDEDDEDDVDNNDNNKSQTSNIPTKRGLPDDSEEITKEDNNTNKKQKLNDNEKNDESQQLVQLSSNPPAALGFDDYSDDSD